MPIHSPRRLERTFCKIRDNFLTQFPMLGINTGHVLIFVSALFFAISSYAILFSAFLPLTGIPVLDALAEDKHYKYFAILVVPMFMYFVIANWVGWQYFRNS